MGKPSGFRRWNLIGLALGAGMKYGERFILVLFQQRIDVGKPGLGKMRDKLAEFRVELRLDPRHIFALRTDARFHARNAVRKRQIEKKYRVAFRQSPFQRPAEVAVDDPAVFSEYFGERRVKFRFGNGRFVRPVPEKIKVIERQSGPVPQPPGKRALSRSRDSRSRGFFFMEV